MQSVIEQNFTALQVLRTHNHPGIFNRMAVNTACQRDELLRTFIEKCSSPVFPESITKHLSWLDDSAAKLKRLRNSFVPIAAIPDELLVEIMSYFIVEESRSSVVVRLGWATSTCHHWRAVALSASKLWAYVDLSRIRRPWTQELIRRSGSARLCIFNRQYYDQTPEDLLNIHLFLSANFLRIQRVLRLVETAELLMLFLAFLESGEVPLLEDLDIELDRYADGLPLIQVNARTVALRRVRLAGIPISWDSSIFQNLTSLSVTGLQSPVAPNMVLAAT